ncbi:MAG TPA: hypothetical protein VH165_19355 [Kofleriaceae bacterium]|jgi:hypothetical protein|nr:hypothetical protein [Kofleriaceae bacterium]
MASAQAQDSPLQVSGGLRADHRDVDPVVRSGHQNIAAAQEHPTDVTCGDVVERDGFVFADLLPA